MKNKVVAISIVIFCVISYCLISCQLFQIIEPKSNVRNTYARKIVLDVDIDKSFNSDEEFQIVKALNLWQDKINNNDFYWRMDLPNSKSVDTNATKRLSFVKNTKSIKNSNDTYTTGFVNSIGGDVIYIMPEAISLTKTNMSVIVAHEIGHALGVLHCNLTSEYFGLMSPSVHQETKLCFTAHDFIQIQRDIGLSVNIDCKE